MLAPLPPAPSPAPAHAALVARADAAAPAEALRLLEPLAPAPGPTWRPGLKAPPGATDPALGGRRARALVKLGRYDDAARTYWAILATHRDQPDAYLGLAWAYLEQGQFGMAQPLLEQGLKLFPDFQPGWRELTRTYYWLKRYDRSVAAGDRAVALLPTDADAWRYQGLALGMGGNLPRAVDSLTQASALDPQDALSRRLRGRFLLALKRPREARVALDAALRLNPADAEARALLVQALREEGKPFQALALWWRGTR